MKKITRILAMGLIISSSIAQAQELTLEECINLALENNARMRTAEYSLQASRETSREAFTNYFPSIAANGIAFTANHGMLQHNIDLPLSALIPNMPDMNFDISLLKKGSYAGLNLIQRIFLGGRVVNGNRLAHVGEEVSRLQKRQTADEVRKDVEQYYWQLDSLHSKH